MTESFVYIALVAGLAALALAVYYSRVVLAAPRGNDRMIELSEAIRDGANAFLRREYIWVAVFVAAMGLLIAFLLDDGVMRALAFVFGAILSAAAGFVGMRVATGANSRTTEAARVGGIGQALPLAFRGGAVMGFTVAGLGLLGVVLGYLVVVQWGGIDIGRGAEIITAIGLGGSSVALFARVGGGI